MAHAKIPRVLTRKRFYKHTLELAEDVAEFALEEGAGFGFEGVGDAAASEEGVDLGCDGAGETAFEDAEDDLDGFLRVVLADPGFFAR